KYTVDRIGYAPSAIVGNLGCLWLDRRGGRGRILRAGLTVRRVVAREADQWNIRAAMQRRR
ncbi:MAG: hypothetical protein WCB59_08450, partial [Candidatus Sulfotelmatobacter sp.]